MFDLTREEIRNISQIVICSEIKHARNVNVFTEQGVAMLSSVLNSERAIQCQGYTPIYVIEIKSRKTDANADVRSRKEVAQDLGKAWRGGIPADHSYVRHDHRILK